MGCSNNTKVIPVIVINKSSGIRNEIESFTQVKMLSQEGAGFEETNKSPQVLKYEEEDDDDVKKRHKDEESAEVEMFIQREVKKKLQKDYEVRQILGIKLEQEKNKHAPALHLERNDLYNNRFQHE